MKKITVSFHRTFAVAALIIAVSIIFAFPSFAARKSSNANLRRAYLNYIQRYRGTGSIGCESYQYYMLVDLNRDGVKECIMELQAGQNLHMAILTYRGGKVRKLFDSIGVRGFWYNASKKKICIMISYGINSRGKYYIYKFNGKKLKQITNYTFIVDPRRTNYYHFAFKYYHGKRRISEANFNKTMKPIFKKWSRFPNGIRF